MQARAPNESGVILNFGIKKWKRGEWNFFIKTSLIIYII